jgi:metal-responsive CopG/Arc/MetJ family transcriptional regulator
MKLKTSITLSSELLEAIDARTREGQSRSDFIEAALRVFIAQLQRRERDARDIDLINRHADELRKEALDVLDYQVIP